MKTFSTFIREMAQPLEDHRSMMFYHGTSNEEHAQSILKSGMLKAPDEDTIKTKYQSTRGKTSPVKGKVYVTPHLNYAQIYGIGGDMAGSKTGGDRLKEKSSSGYGYVFGVHGSNLKDVQPDEDSVGEFVANHADRRWSGNKRDLTKFHTYAKDDTTPARENMFHRLKSLMTPKQFHGAADGMISSQASGGKRAMKGLSDHEKQNLIKWGAHVAHTGDLPITKAWRIHHSKVSLLKSDGSNFHEHAEEIPVNVGGPAA